MIKKKKKKNVVPTCSRCWNSNKYGEEWTCRANPKLIDRTVTWHSDIKKYDYSLCRIKNAMNDCPDFQERTLYGY